MTRRAALAAFRTAMGGLTCAAIARQFAIQLHGGFSVVNFFSYFTNLSNLLAAGVFIRGALRIATGRLPTHADALLRGAATVAMVIVGVVFVALLRNADLGQLLPWVDTVLHYVMPVAVVIDWIADPPCSPLGVRAVALWLAYPLVYIVYVLTRGAATAWYPYPFLNPANVGGARGVAPYIAAILVLFVVVGWSAVAVATRGRTRRTAFAP